MRKYIKFPDTISGLSRIFMMILAGMMIVLVSCQKEEDNDIKLAGELSLNASSTEIVLNQKNDKDAALTLTWTTGTNNGTGASISYILQMDKEGSYFANAHVFDMGKAVYGKSFTVSGLNSSLLDEYGFAAGTAAKIQARVIATISTIPVTYDTSAVVAITVTSYVPVSTTLYIIGDASPNGWDVNTALALTPDETDPTIFVFSGGLGTGNYKFITTLGQLLPSYNKGADENHIIFRTSDSEPDNQFTIADAGMYKITVSLLDLTIEAVKQDLPPYETIYMVGDASPNGWDITNATQLTQDPENLYLFTYMGVMTPGDFKFPVNRNPDWGQDMYMKLTDSTMYLHHGGDPDDNKWSIAKKGFYIIKLNLLDNTISIQREKLYMVGSATPIGWSIDQSIELTEDETDGCIFTYTGPMVAGEFKFPVNRRSDWGQDMYMRIDDNLMYRHTGGAPDDNKWNITEDGDYVIIANLETLAISFVKQ